MSNKYIQVSEEEGDEPMELPLEQDGTLTLSTLQAHFAGACSLNYRLPGKNTLRGLRLNEGKLHPPSLESGWGKEQFFCVFPKENKRKSDENLGDATTKIKRTETKESCCDLICLGLPFKTTERNFHDYFSHFGEVLWAEVKKDANTGRPKGFGFVRYASYEAQLRVLAQSHFIAGRWCAVKIPSSKVVPSKHVPNRVFVGRLTENISSCDLKEYFSKFGEVTAATVIRPSRNFGFVTFMNPKVSRRLYDTHHVIKGVSVYVSVANLNVCRNRNGGNQNKNEAVVPPSLLIRQSISNFDIPNLKALNISPQKLGLNSVLRKDSNQQLKPAAIAEVIDQWQMVKSLQNNQQGFQVSSNINSANCTRAPCSTYAPWSAYKEEE